jgi:hypothetical protein
MPAEFWLLGIWRSGRSSPRCASNAGFGLEFTKLVIGAAPVLRMGPIQKPACLIHEFRLHLDLGFCPITFWELAITFRVLAANYLAFGGLFLHYKQKNATNFQIDAG